MSSRSDQAGHPLQTAIRTPGIRIIRRKPNIRNHLNIRSVFGTFVERHNRIDPKIRTKPDNPQTFAMHTDLGVLRVSPCDYRRFGAASSSKAAMASGG